MSWRPGKPTNYPLQLTRLKNNTLYHVEVNGVLYTLSKNQAGLLRWRELYGPAYGEGQSEFAAHVEARK